jgi:hypothetical protein
MPKLPPTKLARRIMPIPIVPLYFPFTFLSPQVGMLMKQWFGTIAVYQPSAAPCPHPMATPEISAMTDLRIPLTADHDEFLACCEAYRHWGRFHEGEDMAVLKTHLLTQPPFSTDDSPHAIRDSVRRGGRPPLDKSMPDHLVARVFLQLAQDFDVNRWETGGGLRAVDRMEKNMFEQILGEGSEAIETPARRKSRDHEDSGGIMTTERLAAWSILLNADQSDTGIFVTDSAAVITHMIENTSTLIRAGTFSPPRIDADISADNAAPSFLETISKLIGSREEISAPGTADGSDDSTTDGNARLDVYLVPNITPRRFFNGLARHKNGAEQTGIDAAGIFHTAVAHIRT